MASRYLSSLSEDEYKKLTQKLHEIQAGSCFICQKAIDLALHETNIDHIVPLAAKGKDAEENFALAHDTCNKSKQDANLRIARVLHRLKDIQETVQAEEGRSASLKDVLAAFCELLAANTAQLTRRADAAKAQFAAARRAHLSLVPDVPEQRKGA